MKSPVAPLALAIGLSLVVCGPSEGQVYEDAVMDGASQVLGEIMAIPIRQIPESLLSEAQGIAIIPNLVKGGFVVGVRHGRGVVAVRDQAGAWKAPVFVTLTGGSFGWQIGLQATDVILVFKTRNSVDGLMRGKFTLGVDAAAAAGPVGREVSAATDARLKAEIYSYSRSRGLFAGLALDGSALQVDGRANANYYGSAMIPAGEPANTSQLRPSAKKLLEQIARYTRTTVAGTTTGADALGPMPPPPNGATDAQAVRRQLADALRRLDRLLDEAWKKYLALPEEVYREGAHPQVEALNQAVARFDNVARAPEYQRLAQQPEFRVAHELLKKYSAIETQRAAK